ncbi:MAG: flagellar basal body L-ring protein FlgH [Spongiibacteraceae bacterium]|nr:flagellar basal body L-ring protein FlgH [Spongiibacteraceae bacterium]
MIRFANKNQLKLALSLLVVVLQACTIASPPKPDDPTYAPVYSAARDIPTANPGGIYQPEYSLSLYEDRRATRVGDILTILLSERTSSSKTADTEIKKDNSIGIDEPTLLGKSVSVGGYSIATSLEQSREFTGESASDQSNSLSGSIAVTVAEILPNGLLVVRGEKWMTLNSGEEYIRIRGLVRPQDIEPDNTIQSSLLADARITYSGTGDFANSNKQGWASQFFNTVFWPF